jgi:hypothetical protein
LRFVETRTTSNAFVDRHAAQAAHQTRGRRRIRNAHFAEADHVGAERRVIPHASGTRLHRGKRLFMRHRGFAREVARAGRNWNVDETLGRRQRRCNA